MQGSYRIRLGKQAAQILMVLLQNAGEIVSRESLRDTLWPDGVIVNHDAIINNGVSRLRHTFRDQNRTARIIECLPKMGYRLIPPVERVLQKQGATPSRPSSPVAIPPAPELVTIIPVTNQVADIPADSTPYIDKHREAASSASIEVVSQWPAERKTLHARRSWRWIATALAIVCIGATTFWIYQRNHASARLPVDTPVQGTQEVSVYLAPLQTSTSGAQEIGNTFRLELADALAQVPQLHVLSIYSPDDPRWHRDPKASNLLLGSVIADGNTYRIRLELVRASDSSHLASFEFNGRPDQMAVLRQNAAEQIYRQIMLLHREQRPHRGTNSPAAYDAYLAGQDAFYQLRSTQSKEPQIQPALDNYQKAVALDPEFAMAWTGISQAYLSMALQYPSLQGPAFEKAYAAAQKAAALDPTSAEIHSVLAPLDLYTNWNWQAAEHEERLAVSLDPSIALYHQWLAILLQDERRYAEAFHEVEIAHQCDPEWYPAYLTELYIAVNAQDHDRVSKVIRKLQVLRPANARTLDNVANALWYIHRYEQAIEKWHEMAVMEGDADRAALEEQGLTVFRHGGVHAYAELRIKAIQTRRGVTRHPNDFFAGEWYAAVGDTKRAVASLKQQIDAHDPSVVNIASSEAVFSSLQSEPEYQSLLAHINLAQVLR